MKNMIKTESVAEFLARGGKITKVANNVGKRAYKAQANKIVSSADVEHADFSALPQALKIKFGIK